MITKSGFLRMFCTLLGIRTTTYSFFRLIIITKTSASAVTSFIPTLVATFQLGRVQTLLLVAPPYVFAAAISIIVSRMSDKLGERAYHIIAPMVFAIFGYAVAGITMSTAARYLSLFLMLGGVYGSYNVALAWISNTVRLAFR
jgi:nitrate/nitrite transporter NarK